MITAEENKLLTETGPGTPGGELMRRYWHPIAKASEVPKGGAPVPVRFFSEDLVLFRDENGRVGLLGRLCSHRCADLSYGRLEDGGLRCLYHGWLYDVEGRCLEAPAEADNTNLKDDVRHKAYPCKEKAGLIFTYFGHGTPPAFPEYEFLQADEDHTYTSKVYIDCNYLQSLEGNIDPSHLSYLHTSVKPVDHRPVPGAKQSADQFYAGDRRPELEVEPTQFGLRIYSIRRSGEDARYLRVTNFIMPNKAAIVGNEGRVGEGYSVNWHVPIDDTHHIRFDIVFNRKRPIDKEEYDRRAESELTPEGRLVRNQANRYLQNREEMKTNNYTGMGDFFIVHDSFATETPGPIHDRTKEYLGTTDIAIVRARRQLLQGIKIVQEGKDPLHARGEELADIVVVSKVISKSEDHRQYWRKFAEEIASS
jgi:phthalate 4,5-dioxygenase oxygenase subunit